MDKLTDLERELLEALKEVMEWIDNCSPDFIGDDRWSYTEQKVANAKAKSKAKSNG